MSQILPQKFTETKELVIPAYDERPALSLDFTRIREAEIRLLEARVVNPATYSDLEFCFNEGYREAKKNMTEVAYEITQAEKIMRRIKSEFLLDEYPGFLKETKIKDNAAIRDAYLERQKPYVDAVDRINMLKAVESLLEGKVKVFENVCRYMKKSMDLIIRSGINSNKY